ncbi:HAD family hydrolase [candidate division KSB1 bacterium]
MIETLIFDLDGTLIDPRRDFFNSLNRAMVDFDLEPFQKMAQVGRFLGPGVAYMVNTVLPEERQHEAPRFIEHYRSIYREHCLDETTLYSGVLETLPRIEGRKMAIATNKPGYLARHILDGFEIGSYFPLIVSPDDVAKPKPDPEIIELSLHRLDARRETTMIIGDSYCDIESGQAARLVTCGAAYGFNDRSVLEPLKPDYLIDRFEQLLDII